MSIDEATVFIHDTDLSENQDLHSDNIYRIATAEEFASTKELCALRPRPMHYDELGMLKATRRMSYVILRPDRVAFAACSSLAELEQAVVALSRLTKGEVIV